jgi:hypothetical protein
VGTAWHPPGEVRPEEREHEEFDLAPDEDYGAVSEMDDWDEGGAERDGGGDE